MDGGVGEEQLQTVTVFPCTSHDKRTGFEEILKRLRSRAVTFSSGLAGGGEGDAMGHWELRWGEAEDMNVRTARSAKTQKDREVAAAATGVGV